MKLFVALVLLAAVADFAAAKDIPLPRPRPRPPEAPLLESQEEPKVEESVQPSACRLRLTADLAIAPSISSIAGPGECGGTDLVRCKDLQSVRLRVTKK